MSTDRVIFSRPYRARRELANLATVLASDHSHGDGPFTASATAKLRAITEAPHALLTTSCTSALEMAGLLLELGPEDEVIVPSFAFTSTATSMALRGATCVFADIDPATGNLDPESVAAAIGPRTKAVVVIHYGGVAADMAGLLELAAAHGFAIVEDNAHGLGGRWRGRPLGTIGTLGTLSFHDTKNVHCGEGGALLLTDDILMGRAEIIREKGTDRARFLRGAVDKYSWQDIGSSYLPSELNAAVLDAQLDEFDRIQAGRHRVWNAYAAGLPDWAARNDVRLMSVPADREHTAHLFYLRTPTEQRRDDLIAHLAARGISAPFHYVPLDSSPAGLKLGRTPYPCVRSAEFSGTVVRLPLWPDLADAQVERVIEAVTAFTV
ncbi:dTDP-4-amino-4,6-dideoxygalactose transaminase [Nocardia farcinica]|uniref:UDP-4-amino-4-deoxy-L-arabinose--oxoglutarate aminotransferase n=1 Tax=Nocardia farcinica TaxID=37329 RepID=A0A0H5NNG7_NOCFR|nr:dTDP-4-amino-4,6-dideoxygalactose transaminase [Nocardia farcinica]AXK85433.1 dTDP-4-amino-4,6-dideoxygalactose transaminase [Nocardia farcinica]MBF6421220.1 dTDP-4-amino-4,6-dideoxygalactose transaminase [Nocardia farcinica]MBF6432877.1 dTDP-4-amino-4,6-dideoxygalactose transaminase [Nocardia farcinica]MBF6503209.1 dTDP-4-amino-4,6-dideoxygalactose transaminase [Nocardia farcinica]MCZ9329444.1 dTDP-4-amino-4,6-dideoxygalactose transaminase [Nocardia farcinica]